jgi:hypothetical protein
MGQAVAFGRAHDDAVAFQMRVHFVGLGLIGEAGQHEIRRAVVAGDAKLAQPTRQPRAFIGVDAQRLSTQSVSRSAASAPASAMDSTG